MRRHNLRVTFDNGELVRLTHALNHVKRISLKESFIWNSSYVINNKNNILHFSTPEELKPGNYKGSELAALLLSKTNITQCTYDSINHKFAITISGTLDMSKNPSLANILGLLPQVYTAENHVSQNIASIFTTPYYLIEIPQIYANVESNDIYYEYYDIIQNNTPLLGLLYQKNDPEDYCGRFYEYPYCEKKKITGLKISIYDQFRNLVDFNGKTVTFVFDVEYH